MKKEVDKSNKELIASITTQIKDIKASLAIAALNEAVKALSAEVRELDEKDLEETTIDKLRKDWEDAENNTDKE